MPDFSFEASGTAWTVSTAAPVTEQERAAVTELVDSYDRTYSRFRQDSVVAPLAASPGTVDRPVSAAPLLSLFETLNRLSGGAVKPWVGSSLAKLGYDAAYSFASAGPSPAPDWAASASWQVLGNRTVLSTSVPVTFDIGAAGKGQLVDLVFDLLRAAGHRELTVDAGSDLRHSGFRALRGAL